MSTLSRPVPARPTTFNRGDAAIRSAVTLVALRMTRASASLISASNSSGFMPGRATTSMLGCDFENVNPRLVQVIADQDFHAPASLVSLAWAARSPAPGSSLYPNPSEHRLQTA